MTYPKSLCVICQRAVPITFVKDAYHVIRKSENNNRKSLSLSSREAYAYCDGCHPKYSDTGSNSIGFLSMIGAVALPADGGAVPGRIVA